MENIAANTYDFSRIRTTGLVFEDVAATSPDGQRVPLANEYDKPLTRWIGSDEVAPYQAFLKSFYSVIKLTEARRRFPNHEVEDGLNEWLAGRPSRKSESAATPSPGARPSAA